MSDEGSRADGLCKAVYGSENAPATIATGKQRPPKAEGGAIGASAGQCEVCRKQIEPGQHGQRRRFCSLRCRQVAWALGILWGALEGRRLDGLVEQIAALGQAAKEER